MEVLDLFQKSLIFIKSIIYIIESCDLYLKYATSNICLQYISLNQAAV